jgi:hypothetical protein
MVALQLPQTFHRVQCDSHLQLAQDRWTYFVEKVNNTPIAMVTELKFNWEMKLPHMCNSAKQFVLSEKWLELPN